MKRIKTPKVPNPNVRKILLPCRVNVEEMKKVLALAHRYTGGNISELVRFAVLNFKIEKAK